MREKFLQNASKIVALKPMISILKDLRKICAKEGLYHEEGGCLEKIWHINHDHSLYEEIGDIFMYKVRNRDVANAAYNKFIHHLHPEFYDKYALNLKCMGYNCADTENSDEIMPNEIVDLCDRYDTIVYMMLILLKNKDYEGILNLSDSLSTMKSKIYKYKNQHFSADSSYLDDIKNTDIHLSQELSTVQNHNDINRFAISLDEQNKRAYINVLDDFLTYKNYNEAIDFYNKEYTERFNIAKTSDINEICWSVSDFYRDIFEFYNAVRIQKIAIELEFNGEICHG